MGVLSDGSFFTQDLFPWAAKGGLSHNWKVGFGLLGFGLLGALLTIFMSELSQLGTGEATARLREAMDRDRVSQTELEANLREIGSLIGDRGDATRLDERLRYNDVLRGSLNDNRQVIATERRSLRWSGKPLYVLLGGLLGVVFARVQYEAFAIGLIWPKLIDGLTIRRRVESVKDAARETIVHLASEAARQRRRADKIESKADEELRTTTAALVRAYMEREHGTRAH